MENLCENGTKSNTERLCDLIKANIASAPYEAAGSIWCRCSHRERADHIGVDERTVRRIIGKAPGNAPFVSTTRRIDGVLTTLVRVGEPTDEDRDREVAIILRTIWRNYLKKHVVPKRIALVAEITAIKEVIVTGSPSEKAEAKLKLEKTRKSLKNLHPDMETPHEFGCFTGLAKDWPSGLQVELFVMVLGNYPAFRSGVKLAEILTPPQTDKTYKKPLDGLYQSFPHIATIRLFHAVAVELMEMQYQEANKAPPPSLMAVHPKLWGHLKA